MLNEQTNNRIEEKNGTRWWMITMNLKRALSLFFIFIYAWRLTFLSHAVHKFSSNLIQGFFAWFICLLFISVSGCNAFHANFISQHNMKDRFVASFSIPNVEPRIMSDLLSKCCYYSYVFGIGTNRAFNYMFNVLILTVFVQKQ